MPLGFINRLKERWQGTSTPVAHVRATLPEGLRIYAIGDVHGRADLLERMALLIGEDLETHPPAPSTTSDQGEGGQGQPDATLTVFLGDYIDRGPDSARVVEKLAVEAWPTRMIPLIGNHEIMALDFLADVSVFPVWRAVGGLATLASYGIDLTSVMSAQPAPEAVSALQERFKERLPPHHRSFLEDRTRPSFTAGDYFFCHAGVRPGLTLERQDPFDLVTIRDPFLSSSLDFGKIVVHGHTPNETPVFRPNRIGIDTGAYATGVLTVLVLEGEEQRILSTA